MRVLLLNPPSKEGFIRTGRWTRKSRGNQSWQPIWLAYCTGFLQQNGFDCTLIDASTEGISYDTIYLKIKHILTPDVIVYYWCYDNMTDDLAFADLLAKYTKVILVGPWSLSAPEALLATSRINVMTYGEFEHTILELLTSANYSNVKGVIWRNHIGNQIVINPPRPLCSPQELDKMPFVSSIYRNQLNLNIYRQTSIQHPFIDLLSARGCPSRCSYCVWTRAFQNGPSYRPRSIKNVVDELWYIKNRLPTIKQIWFQDDTLPPKRAEQLSQAIIDEKLNICWGGYTRAEQSFETLKLMKESGLRTLHIGYETNDQKILDLIHKDITTQQMEEFAKSIQKLDLWTCAGFMIFPWQTEQEIHNLIEWVRTKIKPRRFSFTQLFAYPNTPICKTIQEQQTLLTPQQMTKLEKEGFRQYYLKNPRWWWDTIKHPQEWRNVTRDALGLLEFMKTKEG